MAAQGQIWECADFMVSVAYSESKDGEGSKPH